MRKTLSILLIMAVMLIGNVVMAQSIGDMTIAGIDIKPSVANPTPSQELIITAESYVIDLNSSNIVWTLNGNVYQKGIGITKINVTAPALGKTTKIVVSATSPTGQNYGTSYTLTSSHVDMIVETSGYVPPFFAGKAPFTYQNGYRVVAYPHIISSNGKEVDPKTLVYEWSKDSKVIQGNSGYGKQVFTYTDEIVPRSRLIEVKITTKDGSAQAAGSIVLNGNAPFIRFYNDDPLYGPMYNSAKESTFNIGNSGEMSVLAVPFGFDQNDSSPLNYSWTVNGLTQTSLSANRSIVLRAPSGQSGSSNIGLRISNPASIVQVADGGFQIVFNSPQKADNNTNSSNYNGI